MLKNSNFSFHHLKKDESNDFSEVIDGLCDVKQKKISSKYFYDENGSNLFDKITNLKDYYPTKMEMEILNSNNKEFLTFFPPNASVIEFGSGSNKKIKKLLEALDKPSEYIPIDISREFLYRNAMESAKQFPKLKIKAICADFDQIDAVNKIIKSSNHKIGFFPGSTIGNYSPIDATNLLKKFAKILGNNNYLIVGVDLKKDISIIEKAYNDNEGITEMFNKNILLSINNNCGSEFDVESFSHKAFFNKDLDRIEMHLVSKKQQTIKLLDKEIYFEKGESIHTENSYKYTIDSFKELVRRLNFKTLKVLTDKNLFFGVFFLRVANS